MSTEMTDDEILAGLTDEERAAMEEDDGSGDAGEELSDEEREAQEAEDGEEADGEEADADQEAGDADANADADGADDAAGDESDADQSPAVSAPIYVAEAPADAEARLAQIAADKGALVEQFDDGELTAKEYQEKLDALGKEERKIERQIDKAEIAAEMEVQRITQERDREINTFLADVGVKRDMEDPAFKAIDQAVRIVASLPDNVDKSVREIMQEAYDLCVFKKQIVPKEAARPAARPAATPTRKPIVAPPNLARVPAAEMTDTTEGNRFAHLDRLDPVAREEALSKMSEADQNAYLQYA